MGRGGRGRRPKLDRWSSPAEFAAYAREDERRQQGAASADSSWASHPTQRFEGHEIKIRYGATGLVSRFEFQPVLRMVVATAMSSVTTAKPSTTGVSWQVRVVRPFVPTGIVI